jgi:hypothetical protein
MAFTVEFKGFSGVTANMKNVNQRHVPFVMSRTVNALAYKIQRDTIDRLLTEKFMLRTDWWRPGRKTGVNYFPSNKRQTPIKATVNTLARFMERQETGGIKKPRPGDPYVAIPTWNAQPNKHEVIRPSRRYRALVQGKKASRMTLAHQGNPWISTLKNGRPSIAVRLTTARLPVAVMYIGKNSVTIKPRFGFKVNGQRICATHFQEIFDREWANAIRTETHK